jgi:microcystin-dependent protein
VGSIVMWGAASPPAHWAICDGSALSTTTYAALFAVIGYTFGGSGGTFNLPDMRGRQPLGVSTSPAHPLGQAAGAESTVLGMSQIPQHSHAIDHDHASFNTSDGAGAHTHSIATKTGTTSSAAGAPQEVTGGSASTVNSASAGGHNHAIDVPAHVGTSGNAGQASPTAVPTLDPFLALNFIIYKGAA